jgi:hypothetical protein
MAAARPAERSLLASRLAAQLLSGEPAADVVSATRHLLAVQGQDARAARLALRVRTSDAHASDVDYALSVERSLVITWVNRGTLHLIASEDEPLLHALTTPQLLNESNRRLRVEDVSDVAARRGIDALVKALGENGPMTRAAIRDVIEKAGVPLPAQALLHMLFRATMDGLIVRGPVVGGEHAFVLVSDWLGERPEIDRSIALSELARRYLAGHGPADERDLAKWAQVSLRDARAGLNSIASELDQRADGLVDLHRGGGTPPLPRPRLLGAFDPLLLGWRSRELVLDDATPVVTANGIIRPIALVDGRAAGTWRMPGGRVELELWGSQSPAASAALADEAAAVESYLEAA